MKMQKERNRRYFSIDECIEHYTKKGYTVDQAIKITEIEAYQRRTDIMVDDGDYLDENLYGIGTALERIAEALERLSDLGVINANRTS